MGHNPPRSHGTSGPHWPRVPRPSPSIVQLGWAVPSRDTQQRPHVHPGVTPCPCHIQAGQDTSGQGHTGPRDWGQCAGTGSLAEDAAGAEGLTPFPWPFAQGGNGKRKIFSAMATSHSAGGNNRWRHAIYSQKHKGTASWEEAGGRRDREQHHGGLRASRAPQEHRPPCCPQGPAEVVAGSQVCNTHQGLPGGSRQVLISPAHIALIGLLQTGSFKQIRLVLIKAFVAL